MPIIEVDQVTKEFRLGQLRTLRQGLADLGSRLRGRPVSGRAPFKALDNVSFSVEPGEVLGIIGHNGAGKSTLLKLLAGISKPTSGRITVRGKIAPLIEVGAGLVPDLTGRENVYLNATILGMKRAEIERKFDEIVAFAELEEFIDTPLKRYSSGMQVRLAFAVATSVEADILILDEVLAVGDLAFQRKCFDRMEVLIRRRGNTVLLVSHNMRQVERLCSRVMLLEKGRRVHDGGAADTCNEFFRRSDEKIALAATASARDGRLESSDIFNLLSCDLLDETGVSSRSIQHGTDLTVRLRFRLRAALDSPVFGVGFHTTDFVYLTTSQSIQQLELPRLPPGDHELACRFSRVPLLPGVYSVRAGVAVGGQVSPVFYGENLARFRIESNRLNRAWSTAPNEGLFLLETDWTIRAAQGVASAQIGGTQPASDTMDHDRDLENARAEPAER